ncbi:DUF1631 family protein [Hydrogenophaga sp. PAMC20947]|uniref:DUF1631 family protein n=1 Tax=Hydrogenophaga sp. PAMC20947 TaxID=2565558 RepID=UPI00109E1AA9|nr:DUF1631 family protein [Hydrogenophaga sp. PAMC20947]QCB47804.1 DUF1631 domain-containing protein [Hydrogenophaga sp. PAMC20947]
MSSTDQHVSSLAKQARELFVVHVGRSLPELVKACEAQLTSLLDQAGPAKDMQDRRDTWMAFQKNQTTWLNQSRKALQRTLLPRFGNSGTSGSVPGRLELLAEGVIDDQILASRLAMRILEKSSTELNDLRLRVQHLEKRQELPRGDVLLPDVVSRILIDQWLDVQLTRDGWLLVQDALVPKLSVKMLEGYKAANEFLVSSGVMKEIDLQALVKRAPGSRSAPAAAPRDKQNTPADTGADQDSGGYGGHSGGGSPGGSYGSSAGGAQARGGQSGAAGARQAPGRDQGAGYGQPSRSSGHPSSTDHGSFGSESLSGQSVRGNRGNSSSMGVHEETRLMTHSSPLARARQRAQGVVGRLKRMLMDKVGGDFEATQLMEPSPQLQQAIQRMGPVVRSDSGLPHSSSAAAEPGIIDNSHVERTATALRQRTVELKQAASTTSEKATIEIVALMFQSILAEERIPPSVRVWFARLQIPVLRVALAEPEFFSALQHPARRLIDRMGSCVMGFESSVGSQALEAEIKRVVQVIEQYPETGRRVFQLVYDEFQKFLSTYLSGQGSAGRFVTVAQQIEQKETLSVQYTIELRKLLDDVPVRDEVREFLFKVWVEVLAVASVKYGLKHEETASLKKVASELLWAASAKPHRSDRARVIQQLPSLLQRLRQGMNLLGYPPGLQDQHIKSVSDTLADAFMSRAETISQESLDQLANRLAHLEEYMPEGGVGDLDLDNESIEMITGVDANNIEVIKVGGSQPNEAMRAWAVELQIGAWFGLDHNGKLNNVQLAWRSDRGQLYMFVTNIGRCFLIQATRVAAYLQAGLLVPTEDESLTVRATRDALAKLEANPERLLN